LYGRGTADDKAGIAAHAAALRAWQGTPPVGVTVFIEGEEENTAEHLEVFLSRYGGLLSADVVIAADCSNWLPALRPGVQIWQKLASADPFPSSPR